MKRFFVMSAAGAALAAGSMALAGQAAADTAQQTIDDLQSQGHSVVIKGAVSGPLHDCDVSDVAPDGEQSNTMVVTVSCSPDYP